jgi:hypothetical protein
VRAKSTFSALLAGLAFVTTVLTADPAAADHAPALNYPATPWRYRDEVICGANGFYHYLDDSVVAVGRILRTADYCGGDARPGPGPLDIKMYVQGRSGDWTFECGADTWSYYGDWMGLPGIDITRSCPPHSGYTLVNWAAYGGVIYDNHYGLSWPQTKTWDNY